MAKNKGGRPPEYTQKIADEVCNRISQGESLRNIVKDKHLPSASTICRWLLDESKKEFWEQYEKARNIQAELMFEELLDIADDGTNDFMEREYKDGGTYITKNDEAIGRSRLRVDTRKWYLSKVLPKKFGEKVDVTTNGKALPGVTITGMQVVKDNEDTIQDKES